jgi:hypothetical protein
MLSDASRAHMELYLTGAVPEGHAPLLKHGDWWDRVHSLLAEHIMKRSDIAAMVSLSLCLLQYNIEWCCSTRPSLRSAVHGPATC